MHAALEREADALTLKLIEKALAGNLVCLRLCIERLYPPYKAAPVPIERDDEEHQVIKLGIFEDTGTAAGVREVKPFDDDD